MTRYDDVSMVMHPSEKSVSLLLAVFSPCLPSQEGRNSF